MERPACWPCPGEDAGQGKGNGMGTRCEGGLWGIAHSMIGRSAE